MTINLYVLIICLIFFHIFRYIGLKFDQVNQHLVDLTKDSKRGMKRAAWKNPMHQQRFSQASSEWMIWTVM